MAPFPITILPRQGTVVAVTIPGPTVTTAITLGVDSTNAVSAPTSTSTFVSLASSTGGGTSQSVVVGAILGSFFGACVLFVLLWWCCYNGFQIRFFMTRRSPSSSYYSGSRTTRTLSISESSISSSTVTRERVRIKVKRRGGFSRANSRGHSVKIPKRAEVRRERRGSAGSWVLPERRKSGGGNGKGKSGRISREPLFGFMTPAESVVEMRKTKRDSWVGGGSRKGGETLKFSIDD